MTIIELGQLRARARALRAQIRRAEKEAWLLERAIDGALAMQLLEEGPAHAPAELPGIKRLMNTIRKP